ncbi:hypothetical protein CRYUN_Cryun01aG0062500 [Craigia yunnanensis]
MDIIRFSNAIQVSILVKKAKKTTSWIIPPFDTLKFNVDGSARGKLGPIGINSVLRDCMAEVKAVFFKSIRVANSNIAELLAVQEAL